MKAKVKNTLSKVIDVEISYNFWPYSYTLAGFCHFSSTRRRAKLPILIAKLPRADIPSTATFELALVAPALLPTKLDIEETVANYNPQRIMRQFGFDQGAVWIAGETCFSSIKRI